MAQTRVSNALRGSVRFASTHVTRFTAVGSATAVNVDPVNSTSLFGSSVANMANLYQEFRCIRIRIRVAPFAESPSATGNNETLCVLGYTPATSASAPSTVDDVASLSQVAVQASGCAEFQTLVLNKGDLLGPARQKWYHTDTTPDPDTAVQGRIHYIFSGSNSTTLVTTWMVSSEWEFKGPVAFGQFLDQKDESKASPSATDSAPHSTGAWVVEDIETQSGKEVIVRAWEQAQPPKARMKFVPR